MGGGALVMMAGDPRARVGSQATAFGRLVKQPGHGGGKGRGVADRVKSPLTPSATTAGTPPVRPATTGRPAAWASRKAMP